MRGEAVRLAVQRLRPAASVALLGLAAKAPASLRSAGAVHIRLASAPPLTELAPPTKVFPTSMWLTILFAGIAGAFALMTAGALYHLRWVHRLPSLPPGSPPARPRVSVVLAARDEQARIENTLRHLLAQQGVALEIIAVDDRSTDATGEILRRLAKEDARVKPQRVETLPDGWLGKCHACHVGASAATGDWILFTDADCWLKPDVLARAVAVAEREAAEHVTLTPGIAPQTAGAAAWHLIFLMSLANWISGVNLDRPKRFLGMGAFNLVRAPAYRASGGYEALRLTVLDDVKFGLVLRRAGHRTRGFLGGDDVECHWGATVRDMIKVMEKNYFAALEYRFSAALVLGLGAPLMWLGAVVGPFTGTPPGVAAGLALVSVMLPTAILARRLGWPWRRAALTPLVFPALFYAVLKSTFVTFRQGGVRWRDTFYSLERLRAGTFR